jgi:hypothetical protein
LADWGYWAFNLLLVLVGIAQVLLLRGTLKVIGRQTDIMDRQLSIPHRAYLAIGELAQPIGDEARFPMENYDHIAARITSVSVEVIVQSYPEGKELYRRDLNKTANEVVVPGKAGAFTLMVNLPREADEGQIIISGDIDYDTGFTSTDKLSFVRVYLRHRSAWVTASASMEVDFRGNEKHAHS